MMPYQDGQSSTRNSWMLVNPEVGMDTRLWPLTRVTL